MLRIATIDDFNLIREMADEFVETLAYGKWCHGKDIDNVINNFLTEDNSTHIILLHGDDGMLWGTLGKFPFGPYVVATEFAWWVRVDKRKGKVGSELLEAFEEWARRVGADMVHMISLDERVGKYYEKK